MTSVDSSALSTVKNACLVALASFCAYGTVRALQRMQTVPPNLPSPDIPPNPEDGAVMGFLKRRLFQHFYVVRKDESLMRLTNWCEEYDYQPFLMNVFLRPHIVLSNPADVESVLLRQEAKFCKGAGYDLVRGIIGDGLLAVGNKRKHRIHRKALAPIFTTENMRGISNEVTRVHALRMVNYLYESLQRAGGGGIVVNFSDEINRMALGAIGEAALRASRTESVEVRDAFATLLGLSKLNYFCPYIRSRTQQEAKQLVVDISDMLLEKNMALRVQGGRRVFMDALIDGLYKEFSPQDVVDHLVTILFAGHDTTACTLQFLFALLGSHARVQQRLYECLEDLMPATCSCPTVEELMQCEYLEATMHEVLRLYPAAPILYRDALETVHLPSGTVVPKGWTSVISVFSLHRNRNLFGDDAHVFRPERWLGEEGRALRRRCGRCGYIPFSCGKRSCIGQEFARCEVLITVALVVRHLQLQLVGEFPVSKYNITMMSKDPVLIQVRPRSGVSVDSVLAKLTHSFTLYDSEESATATPHQDPAKPDFEHSDLDASATLQRG